MRVKNGQKYMIFNLEGFKFGRFKVENSTNLYRFPNPDKGINQPSILKLVQET